MAKIRILHGLAIGLLACATLAGCALPRMIDSEVRSFPGTAAAVSGAHYRFERLPSQSSSDAAVSRQDRLEAMAAEALSRAGLVQDKNLPRYNVQVNVQVEQFAHNPQRPSQGSGLFFGWGIGVGGIAGMGDGGPWGHGGHRSSMLLNVEPPWTRYSVQILMRDVASGQTSYETTAVFEGPWSDSAQLLPVVMEAALRDYPNPPAGPRKVVIELPADTAQGR